MHGVRNVLSCLLVDHMQQLAARGRHGDGRINGWLDNGTQLADLVGALAASAASASAAAAAPAPAAGGAGGGASASAFAGGASASAFAGGGAGTDPQVAMRALWGCDANADEATVMAAKAFPRHFFPDVETSRQ